MADEADSANDAADLFLRAALAARKPCITVEDNGFCFNCLEAVYHGSFCDADCRDDWSRRNASAT